MKSCKWHSNTVAQFKTLQWLCGTIKMLLKVIVAVAFEDQRKAFFCIDFFFYFDEHDKVVKLTGHNGGISFPTHLNV